MTKGTLAFRIIIGFLLCVLALWVAFISIGFFYYGSNYVHQDSYGINVAGVDVTRDNKSDVLGDGKVRYNASSNTLTFTDATVESDLMIVCSEKDLMVEFVGENKFICTGYDFRPVIYAGNYYLYKDLVLFGDGSLTIENRNTFTETAGICAADLTICCDITIEMPDSQNAINGIVCGSSLIVANGANVTLNSGAAALTTGVRVRGNALFEADTALNVSVKGGTTDTCKGVSVNGDLVLGKNAAINVTIDDETANNGECVRVTGLLELLEGATLNACAKKAYAVESYGSIKVNESAVFTATTDGEAYDVFCCGAFVNNGATVSAEVKALATEQGADAE